MLLFFVISGLAGKWGIILVPKIGRENDVDMARPGIRHILKYTEDLIGNRCSRLGMKV